MHSLQWYTTNDKYSDLYIVNWQLSLSNESSKNKFHIFLGYQLITRFRTEQKQNSQNISNEITYLIIFEHDKKIIERVLYKSFSRSIFLEDILKILRNIILSICGELLAICLCEYILAKIVDKFHTKTFNYFFPIFLIFLQIYSSASGDSVINLELNKVYFWRMLGDFLWKWK